MSDRKFVDARKLDVGDIVEFRYGDEIIQGEVTGVNYAEDPDQIRHNFKYVIDSEDLPIDPADPEGEKHVSVLALASELTLIKAAKASK